jgi:hypothetical protein
LIVFGVCIVACVSVLFVFGVCIVVRQVSILHYNHL